MSTIIAISIMIIKAVRRTKRKRKNTDKTKLISEKLKKGRLNDHGSVEDVVDIIEGDIRRVKNGRFVTLLEPLVVDDFKKGDPLQRPQCPKKYITSESEREKRKKCILLLTN